MTRSLLLAAALMLGGCGVPAAAWVGLGGAGLGYLASVNDLAGKVLHQQKPPDAPPLNGQWTPP